MAHTEHAADAFRRDIQFAQNAPSQCCVDSLRYVVPAQLDQPVGFDPAARPVPLLARHVPGRQHRHHRRSAHSSGVGPAGELGLVEAAIGPSTSKLDGRRAQHDHVVHPQPGDPSDVLAQDRLVRRCARRADQVFARGCSSTHASTLSWRVMTWPPRAPVCAPCCQVMVPLTTTASMPSAGRVGVS